MLSDCEKGSDRPGEDCLSGVVGFEFHCEFIAHGEIESELVVYEG